MRGARSKIAVVAWDLAHNAASCAFTLADLLRREHDVEIIGPTFLGKEIWGNQDAQEYVNRLRDEWE